MHHELADRPALLARITREAGAAALGFWHRRAELAISEKADPRDIVSRADGAVEAIIRAAIAAEFPEDGILGEEEGARPGRSGLTWVIDPIDGTAPFLHGHATWCVSIAIARGTVPLAGAIAVPVTGEFFLGVRGEGATLDGVPLRLGPDLTIRSASVAVGASHRTDPAAIAGVVERLLRDGGMFYRNGSGALMLAQTAAGRLAGYFEPDMHAWDCLAGLLLVEEAGGRIWPYPDGSDLLSGGRVLAAAPAAWDDLVRITDGV